MSGFTTKAIHTRPLKKDAHGSLNYPVYESVSFEFETAEDIEKAFMGQKPSHMYTRISNPTVEHLEQKVRSVTDSLGVIAVSSGMAAIANTFITACGQGDNIITTKYLFGNSYSLFEKTLKPWGLEVQYTDLKNLEQVQRLVNGKTRAIYLETITNPQLEVADIAALSKIAHEKNILLIVDTTLTPPYLFNSKSFGVDIEVISSTKYISGGATCVGGLIVDNGLFDWKKNEKLKDDAVKFGPFAFQMRLKREVHRNIGACLAPHNAYLQSMGIETLALRAEKSCANSLSIAEFLSKHPKVQRVNYPGLKTSPFYEIAKRQFAHLTGGLLTFDLKTKQECFAFMNKLAVIRRATNINDNKTLILHPASTIFCEYSPELRREMGVGDALLRLSVGIEDAEDLTDDIEQALATL